MNEKAVQDAYNIATQNGYTGTQEEFVNLLNTNAEAKSTIFDLFGKQGYSGQLSDFEILLGLKKKDEDVVSTSQEEGMDSTIKEDPTTILSEYSGEAFDLNKFLDLPEEQAITTLQQELAGKNYLVEETGIGDALKVTDKDTGETTTIDLQPMKILGVGTDKEEQVKKINKLLSKPTNLEFTADSDAFKKIEEDISKIKEEVDISIKSSENEFLSDVEYFKNLFDALEKSGVSVPPEAKQELSSGRKITGYTSNFRGRLPVYENFTSDDVLNGIQKYFGDDPETLEKINQFNLGGSTTLRNAQIDKATKLKIENYYESRPDRDEVKEMVFQIDKSMNKKEVDITTNLELAKKDLSKLVKSVGSEFSKLKKKYTDLTMQWDDETNSLTVSGSDIPPEAEVLYKKVSDAVNGYMQLIDKSANDLDVINSKRKTSAEFTEASKRNYGIIDMAYTDLKNAVVQMGGGFAMFPTMITDAIKEAVLPEGAYLPSVGYMNITTQKLREGMAESQEDLQNFFRTKRTYQEAIDEGRFGTFAIRELFTQAPNLALAIGTAGIGSYIGLSNAATATLIASQFGITSAGQKYDELTKRQETVKIAEKGLAELEKLKGIIPDDQYLAEKYELERVQKDGDIDPWKKTLAVLGTGLVEGTITRFLGTAPNAIKVIKDLKNPTKFMDDILTSNTKAVFRAGKDWTGRILREIAEETSIDALTQINDFIYLGDQIDLSSLDDTAVTSIITSGAMNTPSVAYSTILTQVNVNRYKSKINAKTDQIQSLKKILNNPDLTDAQRNGVHNSINLLVSDIADITTNIEADAMLLGADNIKELLTLSGVRKNLMDKAGVEANDNYEIAGAKIDNYIKSLGKKEAKEYTDTMSYVDNRRNDILKEINYEGAVEKVFGAKGTEIAATLPKGLSAQDIYVQVYGQIRQEINDNAKAEYDSIEKEEAQDVKVEDAINRPITLTKLGGTELETPIQGDLFIEGQQLVVEDSEGNITEIGNVNELSGQNISDVGIDFKPSEIFINKEGNIEINDTQYTIQEDLPTQGIEYNEDGTIKSVSIKKGDKPVEFRGQSAIDIGYQILLKKAESPEQEQKINELLQKDEEFQNELREAEEAAETETDKDIEQVVEIPKKLDKYTEQEIENLKKLPIEEEGGATMNLDGSKYEKGGLVIGLASKNIKPEELTPEMINDFIIENQESIGADNVKVGIYKFPNENKASIDITIIAPVSMKDRALEIARELGQESIFNLDTFENIKTGATGDSPKKLTPKEFKEIQRELTPPTETEAGVGKLNEIFKTPDQRKQVTDIENVLSEVVPDVKIEVYESEQDYAEAVGEQDRKQKSAGDYNPATKVISINASKATPTTIFHEAFHAILLEKVKTDENAQKITDEMIKAVEKVASPELKKVLNDFAANYSENIQSEEKLAELIGMMASEYFNLPKPTQNIIKQWLDKLAKLFGFKQFTDAEVIDVLNTIGRKLAEGEVIKDTDIDIITPDGVVKAAPRKSILGPNADLGITGKVNLEKAKVMEKEGMDPQKILLATGWQKGSEGAWKYELFDGEAFLKVDFPTLSAKEYTLGEVLDFPRLYEVYPGFEKIPVKSVPGLPYNGVFYNEEKGIEIEPVRETNDLVLGTLLHEVQHAIQRREPSFAKGGSGRVTSRVSSATGNTVVSSAIYDDLVGVSSPLGLPINIVIPLVQKVFGIDALPPADVIKKYKQANKAFKNAAAFAKTKPYLFMSAQQTLHNYLYMTTYGEVEARNVQERRTMSEQERLNTLLERTEEYDRSDHWWKGNTRKQVSNEEKGITANEIARKGFKADVTEGAMREFAKNNGISVEEMNIAIDNYKKEKAIAGAKAENMFTDNGVVFNFFDKLRRKYLSSRGFMPKSMHIAKESLNGMIEAESKQAKNTLKDLQKLLKKYKGDKALAIDFIDKYLRGNIPLEALHPEFQDVAYAMRTHIDHLSRQLVNSGAVSAQESKDNILDNIGSYMTRSYEVFDNPDYKPSEEIIQAAKNKLRDQYREIAEDLAAKNNNTVEAELQKLVDEKIQDILTVEGANDYLQGSKLGSKGTSILKQRIDIPSEIRALMGEYTDPALNYARSVQKISALVANQQFLNKMKEAGEGVFFFNERTDEFNTQIAAEGSDTMNPLNGMYTTPEIAEAMNNSPIVSVSGPLSGLYDVWLKAVGSVKYSKTILSPATHAKNVIGNLFFMSYNGYTNPKDYFNSLQVLYNDFRGLSDKDLRQKLDEYIRAGIINQSATLGEIKAMFRSEGQIEDILIKRMNDPKLSPVSKIKKKIKKVGDFAQNLYQAEDDFFKIISYENEKRRYADAFFNKSFDSLNDAERKEVLDYITEITKNILPNYSRIGELGQFMKAFPVAGTFISFQIEAMRTAYNIIDLTFKELKDPRTRSIGVKRLTGILATIGVKSAILSLFGVADEEEQEAARITLPPWAKNANIIITEMKNDGLKYINFSASDPHGFLDKALIGYMKGENIYESMGAAVDEIVGPFYKKDILFNALTNITANQDDYGREIFNETDTPNEVTDKIMSRLWKVFEPGAVTSARKVLGSDTPFNEIIGQLTGFKEWPIDLKEQVLYKSIDIKARSSEASKDYRKAVYEYQDKKISKEELDERYNEANQKYKKVMVEAIELYKGMLKLGLDRKTILKEMKGKFSAYEVYNITKGRLPEKRK